MTKLERLILFNQFTILQQMEPSLGDFEQACEILRNGYTAHYSDLTKYMFDEWPESECNEIQSIFHMFDVLKTSYADLTDKSDIDPYEVEFPGFDGNEETRYMEYAQFIKKLGRFRGVGGDHGLNSHDEMMPTYRAMLARFQSFGEKTKLTKEELSEILIAHDR